MNEIGGVVFCFVVSKNAPTFFPDKIVKFEPRSGRFMRDGVADGDELTESSLLPLQSGRKWLSNLEPAVGPASNIRRIPFCIFLSIGAPFGGGIPVGRETEASRLYLGQLMTKQVKKECLFQKDFPSGEGPKERDLCKNVSSRHGDLRALSLQGRNRPFISIFRQLAGVFKSAREGDEGAD
jgi:hypothetical protein